MTAQEMTELAKALREWRATLGDGGECEPIPVGFRDRHVDTYQWRETPILDDAMLARTLGCYSYQSCEHPEWESSEAYRLINRIAATLPGGWDDWEEVA